MSNDKLFNITNREKLYTAFLSISAVALVVANLMAAKVFDFFGIPIDCGIFVFPLTYIVGDLMVEIFGQKMADRASVVAAWMAFFALMCVYLATFATGHSEYAETNAAYDAIHAFDARITIGSLIAFVLSRKTNNWSFMQIKREQWMTQYYAHYRGASTLVRASAPKVDEFRKWNVTVDDNGKLRRIRGFRAREIGSSVGARLIDNVVFETIAFAGKASWEAFGTQMLAAYIEGLIIELVLAIFVTGTLAEWCRNYVDRDF